MHFEVISIQWFVIKWSTLLSSKIDCAFGAGFWRMQMKISNELR